jgi:elongation factor 1-gamma
VKAIVGELTLCTKMGEFDAKKFAEIQAKVSDESVSAGGKKDKKKKEAKPKEEKPKPAPKVEEPAEEMDEAELALAAEPKQKDPFTLLPKG